MNFSCTKKFLSKKYRRNRYYILLKKLPSLAANEKLYTWWKVKKYTRIFKWKFNVYIENFLNIKI